MKKLLIFILCSLTGYSLLGQDNGNISIGSWRTHFSYNNTMHVAEAGDRTYAASENSLYFFDKTDNSVTTISKIDGLQDHAISSLYYDSPRTQLLIGYASGNIDIIKNGRIINLDLTTTSQITGSKKINHITAFQTFAYLATDFGVLKFDLTRLEVKETYREIGKGAVSVRVNQAEIFNDSLFLVTEKGVMAANVIEDINLLDYSNWKHFEISEGIPDKPIAIIGKLDEKLIVGINNDQLYTYNGHWSPSGILSGINFINASSSTEGVIIVSDDQLYLVSADKEVTAIQDEFITDPKDIIVDSSGKFWIADGANGLISNFKGSFQLYTPSGPYRNQFYSLSTVNDIVYALPGGYSNGFTPLGSESGFYAFQNGTWSNYNTTSSTFEIPVFKDIVDAAYDKGTNRLFLASAGYGVMEIKNDGEITVINENSAGSPLINLSQNEPKVIIPAIEWSANGLWVLNYGADLPLHLLKNDGTWESYSFSFAQARYPIDLITVGKLVWMIVDPDRGGGLIVFDPESGLSRHLTDAADNGSLAGPNVNTLALDKDGIVWAGTNNGVSAFTNPRRVMEGAVNAIEPIFKNRYLLTGENITAIEIDGGNRKWIGTTKGAWLFNDAADDEILNFTTTNSPLPENHLLDIVVNEQSGEVFFATQSGLVSYRGSATESLAYHQKVKIFPNPVTQGFEGTVGISGLVTDAIIKITDVRGRLIWQTQANGGTATWQVADYNGNRAATGVYLVFSASEDGEETYIGRIAVVN